MDARKQRPKNIDGFRGSYRPRQPVFRDSSFTSLKSPSSHHSPRKTEQPKIAPTNAIPQQSKSSLLGMTIPNTNYLKQPKSKRTKKSKKHSWSRPWSRRRKVVTSVLTVVVVLLGFFGWFGSKIIGSLDNVFHGNIFSDAQALFSQANLKETDGRVNILVAGDSADDPDHQGADLTDSIMLLSIDTKNHTGFMFSIPRDLWVYVPGMDSYQKINAANDVTNFSASGYPSGGMGELQQIVQNDLGIPVDYEALVNYAAFKDAVNAVGGITIDVNSPDPQGIYDSFTNVKLPNGENTLDGQQALGLARARGDDPAGDVSYGFPDTDFTRTMYQREMVVAILKKATSIGVLSNPLKITSLFSSFSSNVQTDFNLQDILTLNQDIKGMNFSQLGSYTYSNSDSGDSNPVLVGDTVDGQDALVPADGIGNYAGLKGYYEQLVSSNPVAKEDASVEILNGTNTDGLAKDVEEDLQLKEVTNVSIGDAVGNYSSSMIVDNSNGKDPATKSLLEKMFPGSNVTSDTGSAEAREAAGYNDTFVVILGQNYADSNLKASSTANSDTGSGTSSTTGSYSSSSN